MSFFNTFPHLINEFFTPNNWNPFMYAVRYGNMELIEYFTEKKMNINVNSIFSHVSMIHSAVYSGETRILKHVLNVMHCSPNPPNSETSPLKIAMKVGNSKMVEMLIAKGAYYVFGDVYNNIEPKVSQANEEGSKYTSLLSAKDIMNNSVVEDNTIKDCPIKETLRWARIRQLMHLRKNAKKSTS
jgi:ankyrin repeat protein